MNRQELIEKWHERRANANPYCVNRIPKIETLKKDLCGEFIDDLKQLDEPQKPVVPSELAEYIQENEGENVADVFSQEWLIYYDNQPLGEKVGKWIFDNDEKENNRRYLIAVQAFVTGDYEVEKEQLYYVRLPVAYFNHRDLETYLMKDDRGNITIADNNDFDDMKFTESEIKAIDERYWAFAVKVEEVEG